MNVPGSFRPPTQTSGRPTLPTPRNGTRSSLPVPLSQRLSTFHFPKDFGKPYFLSLTRVGEMTVCLLQLLRAVCRARTVPRDAGVWAPHVVGCAGRERGVPGGFVDSFLGGTGFPKYYQQRCWRERGERFAIYLQGRFSLLEMFLVYVGGVQAGIPCSVSIHEDYTPYHYRKWSKMFSNVPKHIFFFK